MDLAAGRQRSTWWCACRKLRAPTPPRSWRCRSPRAPAAIIRLDQVATIVASEGPGEINREDRDRSVRVTANLDGVTLGDVNPAVQEAIDGLDLPLGYRTGTGGESRGHGRYDGRRRVPRSALAVIFIYLVLASQFGSFLQPFAIMSSLPLALVGVMLGLLAFGTTVNIYSIIGFIMLMGLVTKNAILLVDNANQHVREGDNLYDALVDRRAHPVPPDRDDDAGDDLRDDAAGAQPARRVGRKRLDGPCGDRRADLVVAAHADGGAGAAHLHRGPRRAGWPGCSRRRPITATTAAPGE